MQRVLILGSGVGGTMVANHLARELRRELAHKDVEIRLLGESTQHVYQPGFLFVMFNEAPLDRYVRPQPEVLVPGVVFQADPAVRIDLADQSVHTASGARYDYDYLIIATGSYPDPGTVPGLAEGAHIFYTAEGAARLRRALAAFGGGRVVVTVDVPHKCPVAPLEVTLMLDDYFRRLGRRDQVELVYTYPIGRVHSLQPVADWAAPELERRQIKVETFFNPEKVDPEKKIIQSLEGSSYSYDLLIAIPAHKGARVIRDSGLGDENGFLPTDRYTLQLKDHPNVYVLGDATDLPVSKAGSVAHYQAGVVAHNVLDALRGLPQSHRYDGKVFCFVESSMDQASYVAFSYTRPPQPAKPSPLLFWFKAAYNDLYWLSARGLL